jgi:CubicO group peptidase (beta-lactamase class C family)
VKHGSIHFLFLVAVACSVPAMARTPASSRALEERVDEYLSPYIDTGNFSGSVLIAQRGKVLLSKGYGFADRAQDETNGPGTAYYLASTSRIFTSAAIMLLEQQGKLTVTDRLSKFLPGWPRGDEITIHHLLTLSSGIPNINTLSGYAGWSQSPQTPASLCEKFRDLPLEFAPGAKSVHCNSNYNVLALLIEKISGRTYGMFLEQEFLAPLGMTRTAHDSDSERVVPYRAIGYEPVGHARLKPHYTLHWSVKTGNGSIYSTTEDLYRFDRMLVENSLLDESSTRELFTEHFAGNGYGWFVVERDGAKEIVIGGRSPGFGSSWRRSTNEDVTVIVLGNIYNGVPSTITRDLTDLVIDGEVKSPPLLVNPPASTKLRDIEGSYQFGPDFYRPNAKLTFHEEDGQLFQRSWGSDAWMIPAGDMTFIHRTYWSTLVFERDESGEVYRLRYDNFVGVRD